MLEPFLPILLLLAIVLSDAGTPQQTATAIPRTTAEDATMQGDPTEGQFSLMNALLAAGARMEQGDPVE